MDDLLASCSDLPRRSVPAGEIVIAQGEPLRSIYLLETGSVEIERDGARLARLDSPGSVLGEMSTLLKSDATATTRAVTDATFLVADDAESFLTSRPDVLFAVASALARRLDNLTGHLVDVKRQYGGDDGHLGMLDDVLSSLMHHQSRRVTPGSARMPELDY